MSLGVTAGARIPHLLSNIDPYFDNTILLLRGQGVDGGSVITDSSNPVAPYQGNWNPPDSITSVITSEAQNLPGFGPSSLEFPSAGADIRYSSASAKAWLGSAITASAVNSQVWTMEAWVRQSAADAMGILSYRPPVAIGWCFHTGGWRAYIGGVWSDTWISVAAPAVGVWSHRAMVRNGGSWLYWADGALAGSFTDFGNITVNDAQVSLGHGSTSTSEQQFTGNMYLRYTIDVARYLAPFTPPRNFPAVGL